MIRMFLMAALLTGQMVGTCVIARQAAAAPVVPSPECANPTQADPLDISDDGEGKVCPPWLWEFEDGSTEPMDDSVRVDVTIRTEAGQLVVADLPDLVPGQLVSYNAPSALEGSIRVETTCLVRPAAGVSTSCGVAALTMQFPVPAPPTVAAPVLLP